MPSAVSSEVPEQEGSTGADQTADEHFYHG